MSTAVAAEAAGMWKSRSDVQGIVGCGGKLHFSFPRCLWSFIFTALLSCERCVPLVDDSGLASFVRLQFGPAARADGSSDTDELRLKIGRAPESLDSTVPIMNPQRFYRFAIL
jgi:hypothetical protein